jgi:DNA polymerase-3 subunit epsilon
MPSPFLFLVLDRPLAVLDLETTGTNPQSDRIVEVAVLTYFPDSKPVRFHRLINPGVPIPEEASAVHGITDEDVADRRQFEAIAERLADRLKGCDLAGFNLRRFDLPVLLAEFARAGVKFTVAGRAVIDVMQIYHAREPRDLAAALRFYCGRAHPGAHGAKADAEATAAVLDAQVGCYEDHPVTVSGLHEHFTDLDIAGRFRTVGGRIVFAFGKYQGRSLSSVARKDPGYLRWFLAQDFFDDAKALVRRALMRPDS